MTGYKDYMKKRIYKMDTENLHQLLALTPALSYHLEMAEKTRKEISLLTLKVKRQSKNLKTK